MVSASDWTPMEPMRTDDDNHADLFGGDLFSDELLDIYNAAEDGQESSCPDEGVPLSNGKEKSKMTEDKIDFFFPPTNRSFVFSHSTTNTTATFWTSNKKVY